MSALNLIFSVKFRLVLIIIITATTLILQGLLINDSQQTLDSIEKTGNGYLKLDAEILADLSNLEAAGERTVRKQLGELLDETIFSDEIGGDAGFEATEYVNVIDSSIIKLKSRMQHNYVINITSNIPIISFVDEKLINDIANIIEVRYKALSKIETLRSETRSWMISVILNSTFSGDVTLSFIVSAMRDRIDDAITAINFENNLFNQIFAKISDQVRSRYNDIMLQSSIFVISGVLFLITVIVIQMILSFRKLGNNYSEFSKGNLAKLTSENKKYSSNEFGKMEQGFDEMVSIFRELIYKLLISSERLAGIAEELAAGAEEASASVTEVSETVREFSAGASEQNLLLNRVSNNLDQHLREVEEAAKRISNTSTFVLKVAKRTNILGLNASIEAAKAGKFGLGFNVVAEEVRNLSDDTKSSANEIATIIEDINYKIKNTVEEIQNSVNITKEVAENTAAGSEEANATTSEQVIMLKEISETASELSLLAQELREIIQRFTIE